MYKVFSVLALGGAVLGTILFAARNRMNRAQDSSLQPGSPDPWETQVKLTLSSPQQEILIGVPLVLHLTVQNNSSATLKNVPLTYRSPITVKGPAGDFTTELPRRGEGERREFLVTPLESDLPPGGKITFGCFLVEEPQGQAAQKGFIFEKAGTYKLKQQFHVNWTHHAIGIYKDKKVGDLLNETNELVIKVNEPKGDDKQAFELIQKLSVKYLAYYWPYPSGRFLPKDEVVKSAQEGESENMKLMRDLIRKFPKSAYVRFAKHYVLKELLYDTLYQVEDENRLILGVLSEDRLTEALNLMNELAAVENDEVITPQVLGDFVGLFDVEGGRFIKQAKEKGQLLVSKFKHTDFFLNEWGYKTAGWK